jgi:hypothetical protein
MRAKFIQKTARFNVSISFLSNHFSSAIPAKACIVENAFALARNPSKTGYTLFMGINPYILRRHSCQCQQIPQSKIWGKQKRGSNSFSHFPIRGHFLVIHWESGNSGGASVLGEVGNREHLFKFLSEARHWQGENDENPLRIMYEGI